MGQQSPHPSCFGQQRGGHKSLSCCTSTLGMGWPWLLFSLEELHQWWPLCPRRICGATVQRRDVEKDASDAGILPRVTGRTGVCRCLVVALQGCPLLVAPLVPTMVARIPVSLEHFCVGVCPYNPPHFAATETAHFNPQVMSDTHSRIPDETIAIGTNEEKS